MKHFAVILYYSIQFTNRCLSYTRCNSRCPVNSSRDNTINEICHGKTKFIKTLELTMLKDFICTECYTCKFHNNKFVNDDDRFDICEIAHTFIKMCGNRPSYTNEEEF